MSKYRELVEQFFLRYEEPVIEELIVGFSGIDPPLRVNVLSSSVNHEELSNLLGGDEDGHFHLTREQWEGLKQLIENPPHPPEPPDPPEPEEWTEYDGGYAVTTEGEYEPNKEHWLDGGYSEEDHELDVNGGIAA